jgi:hypothetical protein
MCANAGTPWMPPNQRLKLANAEGEPLRWIARTCHTLRTAKLLAPAGPAPAA